MMSLHRKLSLASAQVVTLLLTTSLLAQSPSADLLLLHGHILTVDGKVENKIGSRARSRSSLRIVR